MNYQKFLEQLPSFYENWEQDSVYPKSAQFQAVIEQVKGMTTANVMQLLNFAVDCMEPGEIYCEIGCFQGATLIGALLNHREQVAYAVDNFSRFDEHGENLEKLIENLTRFGIEEQVIFCEQDFEEFFWELREVNFEEKIGVYFYDGAHDYRSQLIALLLVKPFLADRALIIVSHSNYEAVRQANLDFIASHSHCQMLIDLAAQENRDRAFWNGLQILSWDARGATEYDVETFRKARQETIIQSIYNLQIEHQREFLALLRQEALELHEAEQYQAAEAKYRWFLQWEPENFQIAYNLGILYYTIECYQQALDTLLKALEIDDSQATLHYSLGLVWEKLENIERAAIAYQTAIQYDETHVDAYNNLGNLLYQAGEYEKAESCYKKAIAANTQHSGSYLNLGNTLIAQNQIDEAVKIYQSALKQAPDNFDLKNNLKLAKKYQENPSSFYSFYLTSTHLVARKRPDVALKILEKGIERYPQDVNLHYHAVKTLITCERIEQAIERSKKALNSIPDSPILKFQQLQLIPTIYKNVKEIQYYRQRYIETLKTLTNTLTLDTPESQQETLDAIGRHTNFYLTYQGENDLELQKQYGELVYRVMLANYPEWMKPLPMPSLASENKIRVGYISFHMRPRSLGEFVLGWLRYCDRDSFEIYCYSLNEESNQLTEEFQKYSDKFYYLSSSLEEIARQILSDRLHILVFIDIGIYAKITQLASLRLAPVQCTTWAHPVTSGFPNVDYFLSSDLMEPDDGETHYSEQLVRLPNLGFCYSKPKIPQLQKHREDFGLAPDRTVYLCCQVLFKYLPQYDYIFAEIASQVAHSQFAFICNEKAEVTQVFRERLRQVFKSYGLEMEAYCLFLPRLNESDYLNLNYVSDIFLDSFAWSGGITTLKAVACNLPIVTCPGTLMRGRHSYAILKMLGVTDTIAIHEEDYINIAVKLGLDPQWRQDVIQRMSQKHSSLYEDRSCVEDLEKFYKKRVLLHTEELSCNDFSDNNPV
jgi:protein O-GlcNAc transferase